MSDTKDVGHIVGETVWHSGDQVTIIGEPFELLGSWWQQARKKENGKTLCLLTPEQKERDSLKKQKEWNDQQVQFRNLRDN